MTSVKVSSVPFATPNCLGKYLSDLFSIWPYISHSFTSLLLLTIVEETGDEVE